MSLRFGTDGVRGVANRDLTPEHVTAIGRAAARVLGCDAPFVVGRDTRRSGPMLEAALVAGLCAGGADALLAGVVPTPAVAQWAATHGAAAAMITASHNPFADNGVKLFAPGGRKLDDGTQAEIEAVIAETVGAPDPTGPTGPTGRGVGVVSELRDALDGYVTHVVASVEGRRLDGLRVVVDCGNGAAFRAAPRALEALGADVEVLHAVPDGTNINDGCGSTDPTDLRRAVVAHGADCGLAFDGDADRLIAIDADGKIVDGDQLIAIAAFDLRERGRLRHDAVVVTRMSNGALGRLLRATGIDVVEVDVGDRNVLDALARHDLALGGEQSGHLIYADLATTGDGLLAGVQLLDVLHETGRSLGALAGVLEPTPQVLRSVRVTSAAGLDADAGFRAEVDRVRADLGETGRVLVRPSGTEPVVRVMVEAPTTAAAEAAADRLLAAVAAACGDPGL
jgi:phosphoglucosamine mutase